MWNPGEWISVRASCFLKLLARIGEWHQNLSEKTAPQLKLDPSLWVLVIQYEFLSLMVQQLE